MIKRILQFLIALTFCLSAHSQANITDVRFSTAQVFDVQWYISGNTLYTSGYNYLYAAVNYSTQTNNAARLTSAQYADINSNGRYIAFYNSPTVAGTYGLAVFNSNGTIYKVLDYTGTFRALANGAIFYNGNNMWGTLFTTNAGYSIGQSANFTIVQDTPTNTYMAAWVPTNTQPLAAGQTATTSTTPTVTGTSTSYTYRTVVTGNITRVYRTLVTTTNYSDGTSTSSNGTEELYYTATVTTSETNGISGGNLATTLTTTTTTVYNNGQQTSSSTNSYTYYGTINQTNAPGDQTVRSANYYIGPSDATDKQNRVLNWRNSVQTYNNELYIEQTYGSNNTVNITQTGDKNKIDFTIGGNNNNVNNTQTGRNYLKEEVPGWGNNITTNQSNTTSGSNYAETKLQGNGNTANHTQTGTGSHILFSKATGDINTITATQTGSAGHFADVTLTGNFNSAIVDQSGTSQNNAYINLTNNGGPASVDLQQTGGKNFTIIQSCVNPAGCTTVVRQ